MKTSKGFIDDESCIMYKMMSGSGGYINPDDVQSYTGASVHAFYISQLLFSTIYKWAGNPGGSSTNKNDAAGPPPNDRPFGEGDYVGNEENSLPVGLGIYESENRLKNSNGENVYSLEEFTNFNQGLSYEEIINQLPKSSGQPGGPMLRYVLNPIDGNIMDMRHVLVVGYKYGVILGGVIEIAQAFNKNTRASSFDSQDYYSNRIGYNFYKWYQKRNYNAEFRPNYPDFSNSLKHFILYHKYNKR